MSNQAGATIREGVRFGLTGARALAFAAVLVGATAASSGAEEAATPAVRGDITVDQAVRLALERNHDLRSAAENVNLAAGAKKVALQSYLPRLSAAGTLSHSFNTNSYFDPSTNQFITGDRNNWGVRYLLSQNLIDIVSMKNIGAAGKELQASRLTQEFTRSDLVLVTRTQYYTLLAAQELEAVSDSALALSERELQRTNSLFELGMVAKSDVLKAQVRVSTSKLDGIRDRGNVVDERARLARLIGQDPTDELRASDKLTETPVVVDSAAVFGEALTRRADLLAAHESWQASRSRAGAARASFLPYIGAQVSYSNGNPHGLQPFSNFSSRAATIGVSFPLLDGVVGKKGQIQQAEARAEQNRYAYERKRLDVEVEVREAISAARQANEGIDVAESGLASAEEDLKLSQEKYNVGSATILELIDAQVQLQTAQSNVVKALAAIRVAEAQVNRVRGHSE